MKALFDNIICVREGDALKTKHGVIRGSMSKEKPLIVKVIDVGEKVPETIKKDDKLLILRYAGTDIEVDDVEYLFIKPTDILAKL